MPVIAEEEVAAGRIPAHGDIYFLVDPLDGTKEFVRGGDDYTVNIGLIVDGQPAARRGLSRRRPGGCTAGSSGEGAWLEEGGERRAIALPAAGRRTGRGRVQVAFHPADRRLSRRGDRRVRLCLGRLVAEILHRRRGPGRHLPAPVADQRVGHGGRPCGAARRGRAGRRARRVAADLWQDGLPQPRLLSPPAGWQAPPIGPFLADFAGGGDLPQGV